MGDLRVAAVDREGVLDEIVRADAEEVHVRREERGDDSGGRGLDHDADLHVVGVLLALVGELDLGLLDELLHALDLADADDHRHHHCGLAVEASTQNGLDLREEEVMPVEADAQRAVAEERVLLRVDVEIGQGLVAADVHRADDADVAAAFLDRSAVCLELILLRRDRRRAHEDELGAEQPDALRTVGQCVVHVHVRADVRRQLDARAVLCDGGEILERGVVRREFFLLLDLRLVEGALLLRRADDDVAAAAVEDDLVAVTDETDLVADAEDGRDGACLRDDDDVARRTARAEDDARDLLGGHACDDGRLDLLADEDDLTGADLRLLDAEDVFRDALAHVAQIDRARGKVLVLHLLKELCLLVRRVEDALRCAARRSDLGGDVLRHHGILHHHAVRLENGGLLRLLLFAQALDGREQGLRHGGDGHICLFLFLIHRTRLVGGEVAVEVLSREQDLSDSDAGDDPFSTDGFCHNNPLSPWESAQ